MPSAVSTSGVWGRVYTDLTTTSWRKRGYFRKQIQVPKVLFLKKGMANNKITAQVPQEIVK